MMRFLLPVGCLLVVMGSSAASLAQPPDRLDSYRVLPGRSTFTQTGGFAGVENHYRVRGNYDFLREWRGGTPDEPYRLGARFADADLRAPLGDLLPAFIDVDETLALESLRGELLAQPFAFTPFEVFRFEGIINDGAPASPLESSTIELFAVTLGPWMYLRGETTPRPWMADFFEYEIRALARSGPWGGFPDWNTDGVIDAADYTAMRDIANSPVQHDSDFDGLAAAGEWRAAFGQRAPDFRQFENAIASALSQQGGAQAVPEPTTILLALLALTPALRSRLSAYRL